MVTSPDHADWLIDGHRRLEHHYRGRTDVYLGLDMLIYYEQGNNKARVAPDMFVSFGVPPTRVPLEDQRSYFVWREGKPPDVVWEFGPPMSVKGDAGEKKETYRRMGVREYWLVDPVGDYHEPRVQGFELVDGKYEPMPQVPGPVDMVAVWSPLLELEQRFVDWRLRFWDRRAQQYLELPEEEQSRLWRREVPWPLGAVRAIERERRAHRKAEGRTEGQRREKLEERKARQRAEQALEEETRVRNVLEARVAELEAELRRTRSPNC